PRLALLRLWCGYGKSPYTRWEIPCRSLQDRVGLMPRLSTAPIDLLRRRLAGQYLTTPGPKAAADVVRTLGAVQAQDYAGAKWAVAQRTSGVTDADVERELDAGSILRTHVLRPTWH